MSSVIKTVHGFIFLPERNFYSIFMLPMLICVEHKIWFSFLSFLFMAKAERIFHNDSKFFFFSPASEFKSVINYIDASVRCNERFLWFDVFEALSACLVFVVNLKRVHHSYSGGLRGNGKSKVEFALKNIETRLILAPISQDADDCVGMNSEIGGKLLAQWHWF